MKQLTEELSKKITTLLSESKGIRGLTEDELGEFYSCDLWVDRSKFKYAVLADGEPDVKTWINEETNLPCLILRSSYSGTWCGYVGVPEDHVYYKQDYSDSKIDAEAHWGITYSNFCGMRTSFLNKQTNNSFDKNKHWWIGFDCNHHGDEDLTEVRWFESIYKDFHFAQIECSKLALSLSRAALCRW